MPPASPQKAVNATSEAESPQPVRRTIRSAACSPSTIPVAARLATMPKPEPAPVANAEVTDARPNAT